MKSGPNDNLPIIQTNRHTSVNDALKASGVFFEQMKHILANNACTDPDNPYEGIQWIFVFAWEKG